MIQTIKPYRHDGGWIFDDPDKGVIHEPLVEGIDKMLDFLCMPKLERLTVEFSELPFRGWVFRLDLVRLDRGGGVYRWEMNGMEGWLCPCLLKYFPEPPKQIYINIPEVRIADVIPK